MKLLSLFVILFLSLESRAQSSDISSMFEAQMGYGFAIIKNPTDAEYSGIALRGLYGYSIYNGEASNLLITANYKFSVMDNTSNDSTQTQEATFYGPGVGFMYRAAPLTFGVDYNFMKVNHKSQGTFTTESKQSFKTISAYVEYSSSFDTAELGFTLLGEYGTIEKSETGMNQDQKFQNLAAFLHFKYYFGLF
ncbi:MAG: hypothetical protein V4596_02040 [Bdellovibrionota bacterium]